MEWWGWLCLIVVNIPLFIGVGWVMFSTWEDFFECIKYWLMPDIISWFRGEATEDFFAELKLLVWVVLCGVAVWGEYRLLESYVL
jgi:hypothetical protein